MSGGFGMVLCVSSGVIGRFSLLGGLLFALAGCNSTGMTASASLANLRPEATTLSIQQVNGPAPEIGQRFSAVLESEAKVRGFTIAPVAAGGATRVTAFLDSYPVEGGKLAFAWVLQTSEDGRRRAARVSGSASANAPASAGWTALDQPTMQKIAARSLDDLTRQLTQGVGGESAPVQENE